MTVVVTGASGHVGAALVRALIEQGESVRALVRSDTRALQGLDVDVRKLDVGDVDGIRAAFQGARVVYHAAARITLEAVADPEAERVNVAGTRNIIDACKRQGVERLVHFSTIHAIDPGGHELLAEGGGLPYERSKASAERDVVLAAQGDLDAVIVSPCAVVGPYDHKPSYIGRVLLMIAKGLVPATVAGGQSWVDVRDVARGAITAATKGKRGSRYVLHGKWRPMREFATIASGIVGRSPPRFDIPTVWAQRFAPLAERASRLIGQEPLFTKASFDALELTPRQIDPRARDELGHDTRPLEETLRDTFEWFRERGLLARGRR
jgi:dihydroflavonol-4-reductase